MTYDAWTRTQIRIRIREWIRIRIRERLSCEILLGSCLYLVRAQFIFGLSKYYTICVCTYKICIKNYITQIGCHNRLLSRPILYRLWGKDHRLIFYSLKKIKAFQKWIVWMWLVIRPVKFTWTTCAREMRSCHFVQVAWWEIEAFLSFAFFFFFHFFSFGKGLALSLRKKEKDGKGEERKRRGKGKGKWKKTSLGWRRRRRRWRGLSFGDDGRPSLSPTILLFYFGKKISIPALTNRERGGKATATRRLPSLPWWLDGGPRPSGTPLLSLLPSFPFSSLLQPNLLSMGFFFYFFPIF